ncbi:hypothetical protein MTO96_043223 [Rhipicephalus appendiculatus]
MRENPTDNSEPRGITSKEPGTKTFLKTGCVVLLPLVWTVFVVSLSAVYLTRPSSVWVQPSPDNHEDLRDAVRLDDGASTATRRGDLKSSIVRTTDSTARPTSNVAEPRVGVAATSSPEGVEVVNRSGTVICVINVTRLIVAESSPTVAESTSTTSSSSVQASSVIADRISNVADRTDSSSITTERRLFSASTPSSTEVTQPESSARSSVESSGVLSSYSTSGSFPTGDQRDNTAADFRIDATSRKSPSSGPTRTFSASTTATGALTYESTKGTSLEHLGTPSPSLASWTSSTTLASLNSKLTPTSTPTFSASTTVTGALTYESTKGTSLEHLGTPSPSLASWASSTTLASLNRKLNSTSNVTDASELTRDIGQSNATLELGRPRDVASAIREPSGRPQRIQRPIFLISRNDP